MLFLQNSTPHFIRCIKPYTTKSPLKFHAPDCLKQLVCAGVPQAVKIFQRGACFVVVVDRCGDGVVSCGRVWHLAQEFAI